MKVKMIRNTLVSGRHLEEGQVYDVTEQEYLLLTTMKKAIEALEDERPSKAQGKKK